jgi:hypothetical protein
MTTESTEPVFYDCEASCMDGLPIEIGWAFVDPTTGEIRSESYLVKPPAHRDLKPVWDPDAEQLHGIPMRQLMTHGRSPIEIAWRMNDVLAGRALFSDSPVDDERWLQMIFDEAGLRPAFAIQKLNAKALIAGQAAKLEWDSSGLEAAKAEADHLAPRAHRAEPDTRHLAEFWGLVSGRTQAYNRKE